MPHNFAKTQQATPFQVGNNCVKKCLHLKTPMAVAFVILGILAAAHYWADKNGNARTGELVFLVALEQSWKACEPVF